MLPRFHPDCQQLLEQISDAFVALDHEWRYAYVNRKAAELFGREPEALIGRHIWTEFPEGLGQPFHGAYERAMREQVPLTLEEYYAPWDRWFENRIHPSPGGLLIFFQEITERKRVEQQLRLAHAQMAALFDAIPDQVWMKDREGRYLDVNEAYAAAYGLRREEVLGRTDHEIFPRELAEEYRAADRRVMEQERRQTLAPSARVQDGETTWWETIKAPFRDARGEVAGTAGIAREITEHRRAIEALRASEAQLHLLLEHFPGVLWTTDQALTVTTCRGALTAEWGDRLVGMPLAELLGAGSPAARRHHRALEGVGGEYEITIAGRAFQAQVAPLLDATGRVSGTIGLAVDINERSEMEGLLRESEERFRQMVELSPDAILVHSEGAIRFVNSATLRLLGAAAPEQLVGTPVFDIVAPDDRPASVERVEAMYRSNRPAPARELVLRRLDGSLVPVEITAAPVPFRGGTAIQVILRDLSERRATEAALRESEERFRQLAENLQHVFWMVDAEMRRMLYVSPAYERIWGEPVDRLYDDARHWMRWIHPDDAARVGTVLRQVPASTGVEIDFRIQRGDGELRWLRARAFPVRNEHGEPYRVAGITEDITDARIREQQLRRAERLAGLGTLVGGVAHELNNPLTAVKSFAQLMLADARDPEDREALEVIQREADRAAGIVSNLRLLARQTQVERGARQRVALDEIVRHVLKLRRYSLSTGGVEVREELAEGLPALWADRGEIEQVVINLVLNAEQALAGHAGRRALLLRTADRAGRIVLEVADSGPGIRAEHLGRIFDPFFTTKEPGEGMGLGLSLVHSIVTEHGGRIHAESEPGHGAHFIIEFPQGEYGEDAPDPYPAAATPPRRLLRVLLVDDEEAIRRAVGRLLRRRGHQVDEAAGGEDALLRLQRTRYDVVLSDLRMPGLGGDDFLMALQQLDPSLPQRLVLMTGDTANQRSVSGFRAAGVPVLLKPFDLDETVRVVEQRAEP